MEYTPISVEQLNKYIKNIIDNNEILNNVFVKGEISNYKEHYSGHLYFTLKDEKSSIKCIMFKSYVSLLKFKPKDGSQVILYGTVQVFERDGVYQIYAKSMKEDGIGTLYEEYEKLKENLKKEGLFDEIHKKKIPKFPKVIGVLTSPTGSVIRDIINVSTRRNKNVNIKLIPVPVQGKGAGEVIARGVERFNLEKNVDVIILGRGGGSLEDLWPFNEEVLARAIFKSEIPVISAVGHETDFSISDFVADLRAPTPSAAAELAVPNIEDIINLISQYQNRYKQNLRKKLELMKFRYKKVVESKVFKDPLLKVQKLVLEIDRTEKIIINKIQNVLKIKKSKFSENTTKLNVLSPLNIMKRGYSIIEKDGIIVKKVEDLEKNDVIELRLNNGKKQAKIL